MKNAITSLGRRSACLLLSHLIAFTVLAAPGEDELDLIAMEESAQVPVVTEEDAQVPSIAEEDAQITVIEEEEQPPDVSEGDAQTPPLFSDVSRQDWYYSFVSQLCAQGVISGYPDGSFRPRQNVTVGETLALVLLAAGYPVQASTAPQAHWSQGFADFALRNYYLSGSETEDLDLPMTRLQVAQLAAKALKLVQPKGVPSPFDDSQDGYVTVLYQKNIIAGSIEGDRRVFKPNDPISRAEISAIIWNMRNTDVHEGQIETEYYYVDVLEGIPVSSYDLEAFRLNENGLMEYTGPGVVTRQGVDVASFQGDIDWERVKAAGIDFAIIRAGGRGYTQGAIYDDSYFDRNVQGALAAGIEVGAYFFSQAISVEEAREEALYTLEKLSPYQDRISCPVAFDWEDNSSSYRTYRMDSDLLGRCANAFCDLVRDAGYDTMIYFNRYGGYRSYDLRQIQGSSFWFAQYLETTSYPTFYYDFTMWQYSSSGRVDGIPAEVDLNLWLIKKAI